MYINQLLNRKTRPSSTFLLRLEGSKYLFLTILVSSLGRHSILLFQQILKASPFHVTVLVSFKMTLSLKLVRARSLWFQEFNVNELRNISNLLFGVQSSSMKHICRCRDLGGFFSFFLFFSFLTFISFLNFLFLRPRLKTRLIKTE